MCHIPPHSLGPGSVNSVVLFSRFNVPYPTCVIDPPGSDQHHLLPIKPLCILPLCFCLSLLVCLSTLESIVPASSLYLFVNHSKYFFSVFELYESYFWVHHCCYTMVLKGQSFHIKLMNTWLPPQKYWLYDIMYTLLVHETNESFSQILKFEMHIQAQELLLQLIISQIIIEYIDSTLVWYLRLLNY